MIEPAELDHDDFIKEDKPAHNRIARNGNERGRGSHDQGGRAKKLSRRTQVPKQHSGRRNTKAVENLRQGLKQQGQLTQGQPGGRGRRTVRKRRVEKRAVVEDLLLGHTGVGRNSKMSTESLRSLEEEWDGEKESSPIPMEAGDNSNSVDEAESDDNGQAVEYEQGNWEVGFNGGSPNRWDRDLVGVSDDEVVGGSEDENGIEEEGEEELEEDSEEDVIMSEGEGSDGDGVANRMMLNEEDGSDSADSEDSSD